MPEDVAGARVPVLPAQAHVPPPAGMEEIVIGTLYDRNVFLAGPISGVENYNYDAFEEVERLCKGAQAARVWNPASNAIKHDGLLYEERWPWSTWLDYMGHSLDQLTTTERKPLKDGRNEPYYHVALFLPGWERSKGATAERMVAEAAGIECHDWADVEAEVRRLHDEYQREDGPLPGPQPL